MPLFVLFVIYIKVTYNFLSVNEYTSDLLLFKFPNFDTEMKFAPY